MLQSLDVTTRGQERGSSSHRVCSVFHLQFVKGIIQTSGQIDAQLKLKVIVSCLEELKLFPKR